MLFVLLSLLFNGISAHAIIGGAAVSSDDPIAKSMVMLFSENGMICSGSILNEKYILTAAHCLYDLQGPVYILFSMRGSSISELREHLQNKTNIRKAVSWNFNQDFPGLYGELPNSFNDIGLVKFFGGLPTGYKPVTILNPSSMGKFLIRGQNVVVAGYGLRTDGGDESGILHKTTVQIVDTYEKTVKVGGPGNTTCQGDSGGPAFVSSGGKLYQWGVLSRGTDFSCDSWVIYTPLTSNFFAKMASP